MIDYKLRQTGRASLDFLSAFGPAIASMQKHQQVALTKAGLTDDAKLADDMDERSEQIESSSIDDVGEISEDDKCKRSVDLLCAEGSVLPSFASLTSIQVNPIIYFYKR